MAAQRQLADLKRRLYYFMRKPIPEDGESNDNEPSDNELNDDEPGNDGSETDVDDDVTMVEDSEEYDDEDDDDEDERKNERMKNLLGDLCDIVRTAADSDLAISEAEKLLNTALSYANSEEATFMDTVPSFAHSGQNPIADSARSPEAGQILSMFS